jgi:hypothetical protein
MYIDCLQTLLHATANTQNYSQYYGHHIATLRYAPQRNLTQIASINIEIKLLEFFQMSVNDIADEELLHAADAAEEIQQQ